MRICLLSYDTPHLKTSQVFMGLLNRGFTSIDFLLMPFVVRPERAVKFSHRPPQFHGPNPRTLANYGGGKVFNYVDWPVLLGEYDHFIVCGSNLIEPSFANCGKIINVHAGLIPNVRGLDSFKWAIHDFLPMGNTLHIVDEHADSGEVKYQLRTPVLIDDSIASLAQRHYENEIWMLSNFDELLVKNCNENLEERSATMRMPVSIEEVMLERFPEYVKRYSGYGR